MKRISLILGSLAVVGLSACSNPYSALYTPELLSRVDGGDSLSSPASPQGRVCPKLDATADEAHSGPVRLGASEARRLRVLAGGRADLETCMSYEGFTSVLPDMALEVTSDDVGLTIEVLGGHDTVVLVSAPSGTLRFDDDAGEGTNGKVDYSDAVKGTYLVWIGTFASDQAFKNGVDVLITTTPSTAY